MSTASTDFNWNDAAISRLKALWAEGHSTAEIGRRMGISKNAVIGKSHRLDLAARPSPIRPGGQAKERRPRRLSCPSLAELQGRPPVEAKPAITVPPPPPVRVAAPRLVVPPAPEPPARTPLLSKHPCAWPIGEPGTKSFRFCAELAQAGKPYCPGHCVQAYVERTKRRQAA